MLVVGAGRSGTSTVAGTLSRLGLVVPQPEVPADESNPRGFYEPQWVVDFHQRVLRAAAVRVADARPEAYARTDRCSEDPALVEELTAWLRPLRDGGDLVVKDPRTFWLHSLWQVAADRVGLEPAYLTMLRHPAEVARSRETHYLAGADAEVRRARETTNVAAWCNAVLVTERVTRGDRRAFVRYTDLMADWRTAIRRADDQLGLGATATVTDEHHPVDDFIDRGLNRSRVGWDEMSVHVEVSDLADEVWAAANMLVEDPRDQGAMERLDELHARYDRLYGFARDLTLDHVSIELDQLRAKVRRLNRRNAELTARLEGGGGRSLARRALRRLRPS